MRITAQLIDGVSGNHICAECYDRELVDIFAVQDDITRKVVGAIEPQLFAAENLRIQSKPPESLDAWGCVIRGLWHLGRFTKDDNDQALQLLRRAVALSPAYAKAHSVVAFAEARTVFFGGNVDTALSTARQEAQAARALDDDDPWSYFSSGYVECFLSKYDDAIAWYCRAIELNENFALAHGNMAAALAFGGQPDAAIEAVERSIRMSPRIGLTSPTCTSPASRILRPNATPRVSLTKSRRCESAQMFLRHCVVSPPVMSVSDRSTKHGVPSQRCCGWFRKVRSRETPMDRLPTLARVIGSDSQRPCAKPDCQKNSTHAPYCGAVCVEEILNNSP